MKSKLKILTNGYRVTWSSLPSGSSLKYTICFATMEDAQRKAEELRKAGEYVHAIRYHVKETIT